MPSDANHSAPQPTVAIVASIVWGLLFFPGVLGALFSVMFFDAPGSAQNPAAWESAALFASFPFLCIVSIALSWIVWAVRKRHLTGKSSVAQIAVACLPLLPVAFVVVLVIVAEIRVLFSGQPLGLHSTTVKH